MCRSLASVDNSAVSLGHEHGDQFTCHTDARIRASRPAPRWERVSSRVPMGFQNRPSFVAFGFDTCCSACTPSSRAAGSVYRATIEPRFREIVRDVCALRVWGSRRYLTQSRHLDLRCGMAMTGLVEFEVISYAQAVEKISLFRGIFWPLLFVMKV